jgi:hypothetical protein
MNEEHWLIGLSKSGFGAVPLLFRNPTVRNAAAAWDFPADQADTSVWDMLDNYGTDTNFQGGYRLTDAWIAAHQGPFQRARRLSLSYDDATYFGYPTFLGEVSAFAARLQAHGVQFMRTGGATRPHSWASGWLSEAVTGLQAMRYTASDDFNRADGGLELGDGSGVGSRNRRGRQPGRSGSVRWGSTLLECEQVWRGPVLADHGHGGDRGLARSVGQGPGVTGPRILAGPQG